MNTEVLKFVPEQNIIDIDELNNDNIIIEESARKETPDESKEKGEDEVLKIAEKLGIDPEVLRKRVRDCGGSLSDYKAVCKIACKHADNKSKKLREARFSGDYERYTIEVHALKSTFASLGNTELFERAKMQENAGKDGNYTIIDEGMEDLLKDYLAFIEKVKTVVLDIDDSAEKAKAGGSGEDWSKEELSQISNKILSLADEFKFGDIFDLLDNIRGVEKGPETKMFFDELSAIMNRMDIDKLREYLETYTVSK